MSGPVTGILENMGKSTLKVVAAEGLDLVVGAGLLGAEVVGGEAEDDEAGVFEAGVELFEGVVLLGEAALGGDVDDEEDFAAVVGEGGGFAGDALDGDVVEDWCHGFSIDFGCRDG